ncbi:nucleolar protein 16 [Osmerus eperlanus]|uniref:nucleolar protein 16 n=1 Tax=Osmerus eperlanus TaxID=29151 RepID=UPI002E0FA8ED
MPKAKKSSRRKKFDYAQDRKKMKKKLTKKSAPRIECPQIRHAWNERQTVAKNLRDMGLAFDPNRALPIKQSSLVTEKEKDVAAPSKIVRKPYVLNQLVAEANLPVKDTKTLSSDLIEYVQHMVRQHGENYKAMARDEKNYYQDTPKQIKRKIVEYKRCHPEEYEAFVQSQSSAGNVVSV